MGDRVKPLETQSLAARVRERFAGQKLPTQIPARVWVGFGRVKPCSGCGDRITRAQIEYELEMPDRRMFRLHAGCHGLWLGELIRLGWWTPSRRPHADVSHDAERRVDSSGEP